MSEGPRRGEPTEERERRTFVNLAAAAFLLALAVVVIWVVLALDARRKLENCLSSGRRDCVDVAEPKGSDG